MKSDLVDLKLLFKLETAAAILVVEAEGGEDIWLPKSQIEIEWNDGRIIDVAMPEWLAQAKGLI